MFYSYYQDSQCCHCNKLKLMSQREREGRIGSNKLGYCERERKKKGLGRIVFNKIK